MKEPAQQHQSIPIDLRPGREAFPCCTQLAMRSMDHHSSHALDSSKEVRDIHRRCSSPFLQHNQEQAKDHTYHHITCCATCSCGDCGEGTDAWLQRPTSERSSGWSSTSRPRHRQSHFTSSGGVDAWLTPCTACVVAPPACITQRDRCHYTQSSTQTLNPMHWTVLSGKTSLQHPARQASPHAD